MGGVVKSITNMGGALLGTGQNAGALGTGQFRTDGYNIDRSAFDANADEQQLINAMKNQAYNGQNIALQTGLDQATKQAQAVAASQRGINPALAARMGQQAQADLAQHANIAGVQLQQQGISNLANELGSLRQSRQNREAIASGNANAANQVNAQAYEGAGNRRQNLLTGIGSAIFGGAMGKGAPGMYDGGMVPGYADGGMVDPFFAQQLQLINQPFHMQTAPLKSMNFAKLKKPADPMPTKQGPIVAGGAGDNVGMPAKVGGEYVPMQPGEDPFKGLVPEMKVGMRDPMLAAQGGKVPGRAEVDADSPKNDTVPAMLSPGEIVIPRSVVDKGPDAAKRFVKAIMKKA